MVLLFEASVRSKAGSCVFIVCCFSHCVCVGFVLGPCFVVWLLEPGIAYQSSCRGTERCLLNYNCGCLCSVSLPHGAVGWTAVMVVVFHGHTHLSFYIKITVQML